MLGNSYHTYKDDDLLPLLARSDLKAFSALYNRYWKILFAIAYNRLDNVAVAEDVVQDVFASLWAHREEKEISDLKNYLATAVKYSVLAIIRKETNGQKYISTLTDYSDAPVQERSLYFKQVLERVHTEINKLPKKCRLVFTYNRMAGMPVKQIARELNLSPKTVENHLTRAIKQLRVAMRSFSSFF